MTLDTSLPYKTTPLVPAIDADHGKKDIVAMRETISVLMGHLRKEYIDPVLAGRAPEHPERLAMLCGEKENIMSVLIKLTALQLKIVSLEYRLVETGSTLDAEEEESLTEIDRIILSRDSKRP